MTSSSAAVLPAADGGDLPYPVATVEELVRLLTKAIRAHQLYLPNNPIYRGAIEALRTSLASLWTHADELVLGVTETEVLWHGRPVLVEQGKGADSLPWLLFKDGLRELRMLPGFEQHELIRFLDVLQRVRKTAADQDDLLTLLWEADFQLFQHRYVDLALDADPLELGPTSQAPSRVVVSPSSADEPMPPARAGVVDMADFDATLYFLDDGEIEYLREAVRQEYALDQRRNLLAVLLDIFEQQQAPEIRDELCGILDSLMVHLLAGTHFEAVAYLLREAGVVAQRSPGLSEVHREWIGGLPERISAPAVLSQMLQALDEAPELPPQDALVELFAQLRAGALGTGLGWLGRVQTPRLRVLLEQAVERLARANTGELVRLIADGDPAVALEAVRRAGALRTSAAVAPLARLLAEGAPEQRQAAVSALGEIASPGALQALERGLTDSDRDVRVGAARALAGRGYRVALERVEATVRSKAIRDADLSEKMAFFELYGALAGDAGVKYLDGLLNARGFLGRREDAEVRACAALALGRIGTPAALDALRAATAEKDVVVRNAVNRAMRGGSG